MKFLIQLVNNLKDSKIKEIVSQRMSEFESFKEKNDNEIYKEMCFCFLTANYNAEGGIRIHKEINDGFLHFSEKELAEKLAKLGHRFPNARARFIIESRKYKDNIKQILNSLGEEARIRQWIVDNIKGIGFKEASHFLRNIGYKNLAIIDFHIIDILEKYGVIEPLKSKSITPKKYLEIEKVLKQLAEKTNTSLGELDLYLWYEETGKVLK